MLISMLSGREGLMSSNSFLILLATSSTLDFVCLTIPRPIALFLFALKNPLSVSGPISIFATSYKRIFESP